MFVPELDEHFLFFKRDRCTQKIGTYKQGGGHGLGNYIGRVPSIESENILFYDVRS